MAFFEEDPAADFMAREQESIGDVLGSDNFEMISGGVPTSDQSLGELIRGCQIAERGLRK